ncbi:MAG: hypothetical protein ACKVYV_04385 [Limisphaerales bacterium]
MSAPEIWLVAGPNGAGKTSLARRALALRLGADLEILNPDERTLRRLKAAGYACFADAPDAALRSSCLAGAREAVDEVRSRGGHAFLPHVGLASPEISARRVAARVQLGGQGVPPDRLAERWNRSLARLGWFAARAREFWPYDNSAEAPAREPALAAWGAGGLVRFAAGVPAYFQQALAGLTRAD